MIWYYVPFAIAAVVLRWVRNPFVNYIIALFHPTREYLNQILLVLRIDLRHTGYVQVTLQFIASYFSSLSGLYFSGARAPRLFVGALLYAGLSTLLESTLP